jgi:ABC-type lipoprotein release transport system permease subunit
MKNYLKIAWRNLWRNKRRTMITVSSVFFAILLALIMRSMQHGSYDLMEHDAIKNSSGYIQIHAKGYWEDKTIDNTFEATDQLYQTLQSDENVSAIIPRLESFALVSSGNITKGVGIVGTDPETENSVTNLKERVIKGKYISNKEHDGIMLGDELAKYLDVDVNDTVVLLSQGYHGLTAAGKYVVSGIFHFGAPEMNKQLIYMTLGAAQYFFAADNRLTSYSLMLDDPDKLDKTFRNLTNELGNQYEVMTWKEMMIELRQQIESDNISGIFMLSILYVVVAFGIFGTIMMMTHERKKEFAVMIAVGMQRYRLSVITFFETLYMGIIGVVLGVVASIPIIYYYYKNPIPLSGEMADAFAEFNVQPIMPFAFDAGIFFSQAAIVMILTILIAFYPMINISRFNLISGLRS